MSTTIYKYPLEITDFQWVEMPFGARALSAQIDNKTGRLCVWAQVQLENPKENIAFKIVGTGNPMEEEPFGSDAFVGTVQMGPLVWHIFQSSPL